VVPDESIAVMEWNFDRRLAVRSVVIGTVLAFAGIGITILWPDKKWLGWVFLWAAGAAFFAWIVFEIWQRFAIEWKRWLLALLAGGVVFCALYYLHSSTSEEDRPPQTSISFANPPSAQIKPSVTPHKQPEGIEHPLQKLSAPSQPPRAHIHILGSSFQQPLLPGTRLSIGESLVNDGKLLASVKFHYLIVIMPAIEESRDDLRKKAEDDFWEKALGLFAKRQRIESDIPPSSPSTAVGMTDDPIDKNEIECVQSQKCTAYFMGRVEYHDSASSKIRATDFCEYSMGPKFLLCFKHNSEP
jgi:hypothetical protein